MDVSLQVVINPSTHSLAGQKGAARYRRGDIVGVYLKSDVGTPSPNSRLGFVHITGVPDSIPFKKIEDKLLAPTTVAEPHAAVVPLFMWQEVVFTTGYEDFISEPVASITQDMEWSEQCEPEDLAITQAKFSTITEQMQDVNTLIYTLNGFTPARLLIGECDAVVRRRGWRIPPSKLPVARRNQLLAEREITVTWVQAKPFVRKKIISDRLNTNSDNENAQLDDGALA